MRKGTDVTLSLCTTLEAQNRFLCSRILSEKSDIFWKKNLVIQPSMLSSSRPHSTYTSRKFKVHAKAWSSVPPHFYAQDDKVNEHRTQVKHWIKSVELSGYGGSCLSSQQWEGWNNRMTVSSRTVWAYVDSSRSACLKAKATKLEKKYAVGLYSKYN